MEICILVIGSMVLQSFGQDIIEFRMVHAHNDALQKQAQTGHVAAVVGYSVFTQEVNGSTNYYWVCKRRELSANEVSSIAVQTNIQPSVSLVLRFTPAGAKKVAVITKNDGYTSQRSVAVFAGEKFLTALPITAFITRGEIRIDGVVSAEEAEKLKTSLERRKAEPSVRK